ncbi:MAG: SagB family peptide dehydrogenase [Pseudonocardiaceae bacterium]
MATQTTAPAGAGAALRYVPLGRTPGAHEIDWSAAPPRYQRYPDAERFILRGDPVAHHGEKLSRLLRDLYGQTRIRWAYPVDSLFQYLNAPPHVTVARCVPSGGALYPLSVYVATGPNQEVPPGLYHYDAAHHTLDLLRPGDHRAALTTSLTIPIDQDPGLVLAITTRFWRNAFKYQEFGYRLQSQETGILTAQALALADAMSLLAAVHLHFADERINRLIGLDTFRESVMAVLTLTGPGATTPADSRLPAYDELAVKPVTGAAHQPRDITEVLPATAALHASSLSQARLPQARTPEPYSVDIPLSPGQVRVPLPAAEVRLVDGIPDRASPPNGFAAESLSPHHLAAVLDATSTSHPGHRYPGGDQPVGTVPYCLLLRVNGIAPGAYRYLPAENALIPAGTPEALRRVLTDARLNVLTRLALNEAGVALIPVGNYESGVRTHGDRWYRMQNIEAGVMVHRATLAATAIGLTARIFSDGTRDTVDDALGLAGTPNQSLSMLLVGHRRLSPMLLEFVPGATPRGMPPVRRVPGLGLHRS